MAWRGVGLSTRPATDLLQQLDDVDARAHRFGLGVCAETRERVHLESPETSAGSIQPVTTPYLADTDADNALTPLEAVISICRIAPGPHAGQKVLCLRTVPSGQANGTPQGCANEQGFTLRTAVQLRADQRSELEHLCRYVTRTPFLSLLMNGRFATRRPTLGVPGLNVS